MKKRKIVRNLFGVLLATMTSVNTILPAYAEENASMPQEGNRFSIEVVGDGVVTLSSGDFTKTLKDGEQYNTKYAEGTEVKITSLANTDSTVFDFTLNSSTVKNFENKKTFEYTHMMGTEDADFKVSFKKTSVKVENETKTESEKYKVSDKTDTLKSSHVSDSSGIEEYENAKRENTIQSRTKSSFNTDEMDLDDSKNVILKYLYVDKDKVSQNSTMKSVLVDNDPSETVYMQTQETAQVYMDANGDYKILANTPFVNGFASSSQAYDWDVARGNDSANMISDGVTYDVKSHIITIKASVFKKVSKEQKSEGKKNEDFSDLQFQFLIPVDATKNINVKATVENDANLIEPSIEDSIELNPFMVTRFQLATKKTAGNIEQKDIAVYINNRQDSLEANQYAYDPTTGVLALDIKGAELKTVDIVVSKRAGRAVGVATSNVKIGQLGVLAYLKDGTDDSAFTVGASADVRGKFGHSNYWALTIDEPTGLYQRSRTLNAAGEYSLIGPPNGDNGEWAYTYAGLGIPKSIKLDNGKTVDFSLYDANGNSYGTWTDGGRDLIENNIKDYGVVYNAAIKGYCHHIAVSVGNVDTSSLGALRYPTCTLRIIAKQKIGDYMHVVVAYETNLCMFTGAGGGRQTCGTSFEIAYKVQSKGKLCIKKTSAEPDVTNGNKYYSLKGAQYGVYKSESDAKNDTNRVKTLTIGNYSAAYPDWSEEVELDEGTYYVKEVRRPTNNSYALNSSIQKVTITAGQTSNIGYHNEFSEEPIYKGFQLYKKSANPSMTDGNDSYDISGAQYGVYKSESDAKNDTNRINTLITKSNGNSQIINIPLGDYFIKEIANPKGYALDSKVYTVAVDGKQSTYSFMPDAEFAQSSTVELAIAKLDAETNKNIPQGSASLEGALYKVSYYKGDYAEGVNPAKSGVQPTRYWIVRTDKEGKAYLKDEYITEKSGDLYKNSEGKVALPLGTVTVEEIKAPVGYYLNKGKVTVRKLKGSGTKENIQEFVKIEDTEQVVRFYIDKVQEGTNVKISNVLFLHTKPDGSTEKLKTDADGQIVLTGPEPGVHSIEEIQTTDGYDVNTTKVEFEVVYNGEVKMLTNLANTGISFGKRNDSSEDKKITVENKVRPYTMQIVKTNQFNKKLKGAEFTIYEDAEGKTKIQTLSTDANGILQFGSLKNLKTYYFKETKAPKGYRIPEKELNTMHSIRADAIPEIGQFDYYVDGVKYEASQNTGDIHLEGTKNDRIVSIHIVNMTGVKLPETGSVWMIPTILLGTGCVAYVVYEECKKKKKSQNSSSEEETESKKDE